MNKLLIICKVYEHKKNISREEIAEAINIEFGFSRKECLEVVNNIIEIIIEGLETNKK